MKKILITGIVASGKTTFAKKLSKILDIKYYELDNITYNSKGISKRSKKEQMDMIRKIDLNGQWILEGLDRESYRELYHMADSIIFLDMPIKLRKRRMITRFIKQQLKIEPCQYTSDLKLLKRMFKGTRDFEKKKPEYERFLTQFNDKVIHLQKPKEVKAWLKEKKISQTTAM